MLFRSPRSLSLSPPQTLGPPLLPCSPPRRLLLPFTIPSSGRHRETTAALDLIRPAPLPLHCASASAAPCSAGARRPRSGLGRRSSPSRQEEGSSRIQEHGLLLALQPPALSCSRRRSSRRDAPSHQGSRRRGLLTPKPRSPWCWRPATRVQGKERLMTPRHGEEQQQLKCLLIMS